MTAPNHSDQDTDAGVRNPGRRDFLKTTAIGAAAGQPGLACIRARRWRKPKAPGPWPRPKASSTPIQRT